MIVVKKEKKKVKTVKTVLIIVGIVAAAAAVVAAVMLWKKKRVRDKQIEEEIDAAIGMAFAEDETVTADIKITESEEI